MSQKPKGRPVRKIVSDHFVPVEKVKNNSNRYFFKCNYCSASIEGRDDNHLKHLIDQKTCPNAPDRTRADVRGYLATKKGNQDLLSPSIAETEASSSLSESQGQTSVESRKRKNLLGYVDLPVTPEQTNRAHFKLLRFIIHANIPFSVVENWFFRHFLDEIHPSYQAPSRYVLSHSIMDSSFKFMVEAALDVAKQWRWDEPVAKLLVGDLKEYYKCSGIFAGGQADALDWWETLPVSAEQCPLKALAIIIHSIVPHTADIERYFSGLGGVQSVKRCNLSVHTFESLSKLRASYAYFLYQMDSKAGKPVHRKHAHMHTHPEHGLDVALANELQRSFAWIPPLAADSDDQDYLTGPESITNKELREEFERFEREAREAGQLRENDEAGGILIEGHVPDILDSGIVDWSELERVEQGITPTGFVEEIDVLNRGSESASEWNIDALLTSEGVASL